MLASLGLSDVVELFDQVPEGTRLSGTLRLPGPLSEMELVAHMRDIAAGNVGASFSVCLAGGGVYDHYSPAVVDYIIQRGEFLTAYTSYQPEISQGFLTAMYEFQTFVCELYGLDVANASLYDAGTGLAEAVLLAYDATGRDRIVLAGAVNPAYIACLETILGPELARNITSVPHGDGTTDLAELTRAVDDSIACVVVQQPSFLGTIEDVRATVGIAKAAGAKTVVCADPIAMGLLESPGACGAEIAVGEGQALGLPMSYGGPLLGLLATTHDLVRTLPGRVVGKTTDANGKPGYVLTLQTREQHIRRGKARSNICTNQGLCALAATVYMCAMGASGLRRAAALCVERSHRLRDLIAATPLEPIYGAPFFQEFAVRSPIPVPELQMRLADKGFVVGGDISACTGVEHSLLLCATEKRTDIELGAFAAAVKEVL